MTTPALSLYKHGNPYDLPLESLGRWLRDGKLSQETLLELNEKGIPWLVEWLDVHVRHSDAQLLKDYKSSYDLIRLATGLIEQAGGWDLEWHQNDGIRFPVDSSGSPLPVRLADLLFWRSSDDLFRAWEKTPAKEHMRSLLQGRLYADYRQPAPKTALQMAVSLDFRSRVVWALKNGADINGTSPDGQTPVFDAQSVRTLKDLVAKGASLTCIDKAGRRPVEVWLQAKDVRADLMIIAFLKKAPDAFPAATLHRAVVQHTLDGHPFGSNNKPSLLYRQVKDQLHTPFQVNDRPQTLLNLWAQRALEKKEPERLQWALSLQPQETEIAPGVTDGDLARLAWSMKTHIWSHSPQGISSWETLKATYAVALDLPLEQRGTLEALPMEFLNGLIGRTFDFSRRTLEAMGIEEESCSGLAQVMDWVADQEERNHNSNAFLTLGLEQRHLLDYLTHNAPASDTLIPALRLLCPHARQVDMAKESELLQEDRWISPADFIEGDWKSPMLLAAWCQNAWMARRSEGLISADEVEALSQLSHQLGVGDGGLAAFAHRLLGQAKEIYLDQALPAATTRHKQLRF